MDIENIIVGPIQTNCYLVSDSGEMMVVDPGDAARRIVGEIAQRRVVAIVITHGHWDHINALTGVATSTGAPVYASKADAQTIEHIADTDVRFDRTWGFPHVDVRLSHGDVIEVGKCAFEVIETPGHTPGSICLYCESEHVLFSGDTVFAGGSFGRTDFPGGDLHAMKASLTKLAARIDDTTVILPGHGRPSTMKIERTLNAYMH